MPDAKGVALRSEACPFCARKMDSKAMNRRGKNSAPGVFLWCWQNDHRVQTLVFLRNGEPMAGDELEEISREVAALKRR